MRKKKLASVLSGIFKTPLVVGPMDADCPYDFFEVSDVVGIYANGELFGRVLRAAQYEPVWAFEWSLGERFLAFADYDGQDVFAVFLRRLERELPLFLAYVDLDGGEVAKYPELRGAFRENGFDFLTRESE